MALSRDGLCRALRVHRLVLLAFVGPRPAAHQAAHLNGRRADNRLTNLRWASARENVTHQVLHGTRVRGERHGAAKLTEARVRQMYQAVAEGMPVSTGAAGVGVSRSRVLDIVTGRAWAHLRLAPLNLIGRRAVRGERQASAKLCDVWVRDIRARVAAGASISAVARRFGVARSTVRAVVRRRRWRHVA